MRNTIFLMLSAAVLLTACQQSAPKAEEPGKKGMIKITILYPSGEGNTFDMDYYAEKHMPMVASLLGDSLKLLEIDKGIAGRTAEDPIPYMAIGYLYFNTLSAYQQSFGPNADSILQDIPNYTNVQPLVQVSEVVQ